MGQCDIGVIGMAVMGQNLALNIESKGFEVAVFNRTASRTEEFVRTRGQGKRIVGATSLEAFVAALKPPRRAIIMVKAGQPVDEMIEQLLGHMARGDVIIDGGNSHYADTDRRAAQIEAAGLRFLGTGISGGEYGALHGPSIMPGGSRQAYELVASILTRAAAQTEDGPCCAYLGPRSAGHFVKMVHNGIEYGIMQILAEAYDIMRRGLELSTAAAQEIFAEWNANELQSYLVEITADILSRTDAETGLPLVEVIADSAQQKGTGKWTSQSALDHGIPVPTISAATEARILSSFRDERRRAAKVLSGPAPAWDWERTAALGALRDAVYLAVVATYAQGMHLLAAASSERDYGLDLALVARIWKGGCIIRSALLDPISRAFSAEPGRVNLLTAPPFAEAVNAKGDALRRVAAEAALHGIPTPALSASLHYIEAYRTERLPANLVQAQRDYFGAHTYERVDRPGSFHTEWQDIHNI
ncbi:MAG TPA: NADP-dependent phosphogluconate dehydrogenase [Limnochordia bacterium]